ncbi:MAG: hypothetical protein ABIR46_01960 [Candidatus Saccharimonadales bacterium]
MDQLFGIVEHVREHRLTYGAAKGRVIPTSETIVFGSSRRSQAEEELGRLRSYAKENGGGGLMIREAEWMKLSNASYTIEPIVAELVRK